MAYIPIRVRVLKMAKESNDLAKVLLEPNQTMYKFMFFSHANQNQLVYSIVKFISKLNKRPVISILSTSLATCTTLFIN